jgi:hypothetical protein
MFTDPRRWPEWTASMCALHPLRPGPPGVGSLVGVKQPGISAATWRITRYEPSVRFDWGTRLAGVGPTAAHVLGETDDGRVLLGLSVESAGSLVPDTGAEENDRQAEPQPGVRRAEGGKRSVTLPDGGGEVPHRARQGAVGVTVSWLTHTARCSRRPPRAGFMVTMVGANRGACPAP